MISDVGNQIGAETLQVVEPSALEQITRAEVDTAITTAHRFPRSLALFKKGALEMATLDEETAASCLYKLPRKDHGKIKYIEGESVRLAEIVASCYGNLQVATRLVSQTKDRGTVQGICRDLEHNVTMTSEVHFRTTTKDGIPYSEDMQIMAANAASSKARRNAIFCVVPKSLVKSVTEAAREVALGKGDTMKRRRERVLSWLEGLNIDLNRVWFALEIKGADDLTTEHLTTLTGIRTAIRDNETTVDEAFPIVIADKKSQGGETATTAKTTVESKPDQAETTTSITAEIVDAAKAQGISLSELILALKSKKFISAEGTFSALPVNKLKEIRAAQDALFAEIIKARTPAADTAQA